MKSHVYFNRRKEGLNNNYNQAKTSNIVYGILYKIYDTLKNTSAY